MNKSETGAWDFLEELKEKTAQWETTRDEGLGARINCQKGGIHAMADIRYINAKFAALENMLKGLVLSQLSTNFPPAKFFHLNVNPSTIP